ncbi:MAG TPA: hypothetical protein IAC12_03035 [Candidatus Aphodovivens avistercoris]|nr:hypothetical protein [Candidatus Aphodovivens avistercoris]
MDRKSTIEREGFPMGKRSGGKSFAILIISAVFVLAMAAVALPGCTVVADDRQESVSGSDGVEHLSDAATDAIMGAFGQGEEASPSDELASLSGLSKNGAVMVSSADGDKLYEGAQAEELLASLSLESWEPISAEAFEAEAGGVPSSVGMAFSQDKTVLLGESQPSGRVDVANLFFWPDEGVARYDMTVDDGEGVFLFDDFGITTKDGASLLSLHFRIPGETAGYVASL